MKGAGIAFALWAAAVALVAAAVFVWPYTLALNIWWYRVWLDNWVILAPLVGVLIIIIALTVSLGKDGA